MCCAYLSPGDIARRISRQRVTLTPFETPDIDVTESQFEVPVEAARAREISLKPTIEKRAVSKHTEVMRAELEKKFDMLRRKKMTERVDMEELLDEITKETIKRRDRSLAFFQILVLTSLDIIRTHQSESYGNIEIVKGDKWDMRFSASQMFSASQSQ